MGRETNSWAEGSSSDIHSEEPNQTAMTSADQQYLLNNAHLTLLNGVFILMEPGMDYNKHYLGVYFVF